MRLDKFLCDTNQGTRKEVKELIRKGRITVNGEVVRTPELHIAVDADHIYIDGRELTYARFHYYMLHKPAGVITATEDRHAKTVLDLLPEHRGLNPVGRLDKDTEGLLLLTDDGALTHRLLSPAKHVDKVYEVHIKTPLSESDIAALEKGVDIGDDKLTLPAHVEIREPLVIHLSIHEGRFHQVKRMLQAVDNEVLYLKRLSMGKLSLDPALKPGEYRPLTEEEIRLLQEPS